MAWSRQILQLILVSVGFLLIMASSNMTWLEWNVTIEDIQGNLQPHQVKLERLPWASGLHMTWGEYDTRRRGLSIEDATGEDCGLSASIVSNQSNEDILIEQSAQYIFGFLGWFSILGLAVSVFDWLWGLRILYRENRELVPLSIWSVIGFCLTMCVVLALLGPSMSLGVPSWFLKTPDPTCQGVIILEAEIIRIEPAPILTIGFGVALYLAAFVLYLRGRINSTRTV